MPWVVRKIKNKPLYSVKNPVTKQVHAKATTLANASKQVRLLRAIHSNL